MIPDVQYVLSDLIDGVEGDGVVELEVGRGKTTQDGPVVCEYRESSSLDLRDEVSDG